MTKLFAGTAFMCVFTSLACGSVTFSDGTFAPSTWGQELVTVGPGGTSAASQVSTGNPGFARRVQNTVEGGGTVYAFSRFGTDQATRYNASTQGAILTVDFSIDHRFVEGVGGDGQAVRLGAKQGQTVYAAGYEVTGSSGLWGTTTFTGLTAADFSAPGGGGTIDFSATGAPIRFGFIAVNSSTGPTYLNTVDYDNFFVRVNSVPGPGVGVCGLAGLVAAGVRRRRA
ncbi:MAG: hypothetical protein SFY69_09920 [Planctomycetota bacterium]|nr:hypothetical protein [Planctomycetota bacterium]